MRHSYGLLIFLAACSGATSGSDAAPNPDLVAAPTDGSSTFTLKLEDYLSWCSVSVNSGTASSTGVQTLTFASGSVVNLSAAALSGTFVWGYWVGTAGDTNASHDTQMTTTVTMTQNRVVQACCPFASAPSTPCPAPTP